MKTLAIIGTGISGMGAAYFLRQKYDITFYEQDNTPGGHTNTIDVLEGGVPLPVDTAFMVYNETTYPLLTRLFKELNVETKSTDMSFSVQHLPSGLEFCGTGYNGLFAQRRNIFNFKFIRMLLEIKKFNEQSVEVLEDERYLNYTLAQYAKEKGYSDDFVLKFLVPMSSAVWSTPLDGMLQFPVVTLVRFFKNHCFLGLEGHLGWRTCVGGSRQYRNILLAKVNARMWTSRRVLSVSRVQGKVHVKDSTGASTVYDAALLASHADESLSILERPTDLERRLLSQFPYHSNNTILHTDCAVMPESRRAWSSWNYRVHQDALQTYATTIYDMNRLQGVSKNRNYFISINDPGIVDPKKILWERVYRHPVYSVSSQQAQKELPQINHEGPVYFCGAYFRYGFHEDGLLSGLNVAKAMTGEKIWE